jgi:hypothetical protein
MQSEPFSGRTSEMRLDTPWLASEDLLDLGDVAVEIEGVYRHKDAKFDEGRTQTIFALKFKGKKKELVLNATNRKTLVAMFGTGNVKEWVGKQITLYVDQRVRKPGGGRGETCCGIRIRCQKTGQA